ncbi:uncharacterized protein NECHADRAFT_78127 [Fusarium vanettenii 77-13-4]|uniref:Uncharacterized protein n=1 Tax=Fusarium vanettenii (strain ATCC MYA-4622 / CBS 123669 / FGSC 9596 / NRRL 45880 / 77-13-4) TaxID=660122 RepID=C7YN71_FUSV7|nr:uncharacterized protein NECHADRAFT_78127 [Fusarium vanettenii 77-13-4]EEU47573.1 predicted protein [Fusarium vanettenii 77-13-4]
MVLKFVCFHGSGGQQKEVTSWHDPFPDLHPTTTRTSCLAGASERTRAISDLSKVPSHRAELQAELSLLARRTTATDPTPEGVERIPVALKGMALENLDGRPLRAALIGSYTMEVFARNSQGSKVLAGDMRVLEVFPRACRLLFPREDQNDRKEGESPSKD